MTQTKQATAAVARPYQQCTRCVMDTTASDNTFDEKGVCKYCTEFLKRSSHIIHEDLAAKEVRLNALVARVKAAGIGKPYDCIVGVSGGVDSSWVLVQTKRLGLRPLAVHMDNGWNSELAQNNIANLVRGLGVDLHTHVINWEEYRGLMQAFFDADVIDVELLYDNAMLAVNYQQAKKYNVNFILAGYNSVTEGLRMPPGWNWFKQDKRNIRSLAKSFGNISIKTFPTFGTVDFILYAYVKKIKMLAFLDYLPYNKLDALEELETCYGYKRYLYKHYESIFTRFYQGYILPEKFNVDKRLTHLSCLIVSDQMSRADAIKALDGIPYPSMQDLDNDINYFLKKMGWSRDDLTKYISRPEKLHSCYSTEKPFRDFMFGPFRRTLPKALRRYLLK